MSESAAQDSSANIRRILDELGPRRRLIVTLAFLIADFSGGAHGDRTPDYIERKLPDIVDALEALFNVTEVEPNLDG